MYKTSEYLNFNEPIQLNSDFEEKRQDYTDNELSDNSDKSQQSKGSFNNEDYQHDFKQLDMDILEKDAQFNDELGGKFENQLQVNEVEPDQLLDIQFGSPSDEGSFFSNDADQMLKDFIPLINKGSQDRTNSDLQKLKQYLNKNLTEFSKKYELNDETMNQLVKVMRYSYQEAGNNIINFGEKGTTFYIILNGTVNVRIPTDLVLELSMNDFLQFMESNKQYIVESDTFQNQNQTIVSSINKRRNSKLINQYQIKLLQAVAQLGSGDSFGELALIYDKPRFATIESLTGVHLVTLEKQDYQRVIMEANEKKMNEELKFLRSFPAFSQLSRITLHKLYLYVKPKTFKRGQTIFTEGTPWQYIYLTKQGSFEQTKVIKYCQDSFGKINIMTRLLHPQPLQNDELYNEQRIQQLKTSNKGLFNQSFKVAQLGEQQICGIEELSLFSQNYVTSMSCISQEGKVYQIPKDFFRKVKSEEAKKNILEISNLKVNFLNKRLEQIYHTIKDKHKFQIESFDKSQTSPQSKTKSPTPALVQRSPLLKFLQESFPKNQQ